MVHVKGEADVGDRAARLLQPASRRDRRDSGGIPDRRPIANHRWIDVWWADTLDSVDTGGGPLIQAKSDKDDYRVLDRIAPQLGVPARR